MATRELTEAEALARMQERERPVPIDWYITQRNKDWHETYFARQALKDHQAKGNCRFVWEIIEYMEDQSWLNKGDVIFDPMCGIGSFLIVSALKGYDAFGVELEKTFVDDFYGYSITGGCGDDLFEGFPSHVEGVKERFELVTRELPDIGEIFVIEGDARNLLELICEKNEMFFWSLGIKPSVVISSPPYSGTTEVGGGDAKNKSVNYSSENIAKEKIKVVCSPPYSRSTEHNKGQIDSVDKGNHNHGHRAWQYMDKRNIAVLKDSAYSRQIQKVYDSLYKFLGVGSYVALITRNFIQQSKVVMLDKLTIKLMEYAGFKYLETKRAVLPDISFFKHMNYQKFHSQKGLPLIDWEEATFYVKEK